MKYLYLYERGNFGFITPTVLVTARAERVNEGVKGRKYSFELLQWRATSFFVNVDLFHIADFFRK